MKTIKIDKLFVMVLALGFAVSGFANPGLLWGLIKEASDGNTERWAQVERWLLEDLTEDIDWHPAGEEPGRVLLERNNPDLYNRLFGDDANQVLELDPLRNGALIAQPRLFLGMDAYEISEVVFGVGFTGGVLKAVHRLSGALVAVKTIRREHYEAYRLQFPPNEADLMARLRHPNIVRFYHAITTDTAMCIIMEAISGCELYDISQNGPMAEAECRPIMCQILKAVDYIHRASICHRDLKLENILIDASGHLKLIDFGLSAIFDPAGKRRLTDFCGSPEYVAPELMQGVPYIGPEVDVWAIGVILYTIATDMTPFEPFEDAIRLRYEWPDDVIPTDELRDFIARIFRHAADRCSVKDMIDHPWMKGGEK